LFYPHHLQALHYANIVLGAALSGFMVPILWAFTHNRKLSLVVALLLTLNPSLFLYESYILYTLLVAFLVTLSIFWLALHHQQPSPAYLYAFIFCLNLLILARSLYHIIILAIGIPLVCLLSKRAVRKTLVTSVLISLLSVGWYSKNYLNFGFFGASSWQGLGLWKIASFHYSEEELTVLNQADVIDQTVIEVDVFSRPSAYVEAGYNKQSAIEALNQDDYNNINILEIADLYQKNALSLIRYDIDRYMLSVVNAYLLYTKPPSRFEHLSFPNNRVKIAPLEGFSANILQGYSLALSLTGFGFGPFLFFLLPLSLLLFMWHIFRRCRLSPARWGRYLQADAPAFFAFILIVYTTLVSNLFEVGENERFKVLVEQVMWALIITTFYRLTTSRKIKP
ncbi:MAG: hypothetical protein AAF629_14540, partial [Chloroflexota bacterium]